MTQYKDCSGPDEAWCNSERSRRIEELTAQLTEWQRVFGFIDPNEALDDCATKLATERAAREQAEEKAELRTRDFALEHQARTQAERERDTALARVKELIEQYNSKHAAWVQRGDELEAAETALASERARADGYYTAWNEDVRALKAAETALTSAEARVKELERIIDDYDAMVGDLDPPDVLVHWRAAERSLAAALARMKEAQLQAIDQQSRRCAAETALASALAMLDQPVPLLTSEGLLKRITDLRKLLTSHPAPVAEDPCLACKGLLDGHTEDCSERAAYWAGVNAAEPKPAPVAAPRSESGCSAEPDPEWANGVPLCRETCPQHDGKRCRLMGMRPDRICEPAVQQMAADRKASETALASARGLLARAHQFGVSHPAIRRDIGAFLSSNPATVKVLPPISESDEAIVGALMRRLLTGVSVLEVCGKKCDHGSECLLLRGHEGWHDTQHGCTFYDVDPDQRSVRGSSGSEPDDSTGGSAGDSGGARSESK